MYSERSLWIRLKLDDVYVDSNLHWEETGSFDFARWILIISKTNRNRSKFMAGSIFGLRSFCQDQVDFDQFAETDSRKKSSCNKMKNIYRILSGKRPMTRRLFLIGLIWWFGLISLGQYAIQISSLPETWLNFITVNVGLIEVLHLPQGSRGGCY